MSKIKIKNFGPIKNGFLDKGGWMDIKKVTVFIGNQGSGKSSVAKLISTLTWIEKALVRGDFKEKDLTVYNRFKKHCSYQNIGNYFKDDTLIEYEGKAYTISYSEGILNVNKKEPNANGYAFPKIMYVPAERNFLSAVDKPTSLKKLPSTLYTFLDEFEDAKNELKGHLLTLPIGNVKFEYQKLNKIAYIVGDDYKIRLTEASSGFQSFVPLYLVSRYLARAINNENETDESVKSISFEEEKRIRKEIAVILSNPHLSDDVKKASLEFLSSKFTYSSFINVVEEPEQNLFPTSQRIILNNLLEFANSKKDNQLILTTHSPYIINYLSIAIQGDYLKGKIGANTEGSQYLDRLDKIVPLKSLVAASDVVVYQLDDAGNIARLPDYEGIPSDGNYLNQSLAEGNVLFDKLLEIEEDL
jgi:predicted ATPase